MFSAPNTDKDPSIHNLAKDGVHGAGRAVRASPFCVEGGESKAEAPTVFLFCPPSSLKAALCWSGMSRRRIISLEQGSLHAALRCLGV